MTTSETRTVRVDERLLRGMSRDATSYALTQPATLVTWAVLLAAFVFGIVALSTATTAGQEASALTAWTPALVLAVAGLLVFVTSSNVRRSVRSTMPLNSLVSARLDADTLHGNSSAGTSEIAYRSFRGMRVGRDAVLLRIAGTGAATVIPRAVFSDADIETLRAKLRSA